MSGANINPWNGSTTSTEPRTFSILNYTIPLVVRVSLNSILTRLSPNWKILKDAVSGMLHFPEVTDRGLMSGWNPSSGAIRMFSPIVVGHRRHGGSC